MRMTTVTTAAVVNRSVLITDLYHDHFDDLMRCVARLVDSREAAEEHVQAAFARLATQSKWPEPGKELPYLRSMVLNGARSALRVRRVRDRASVRSIGAAPQPTPEEQCVASFDRAEMIELLAALPTRQRQVVWLRHYSGLSEIEIADRLAISPGSVKTHCSRAMISLRTLAEAGDLEGAA